MDFGSTYSYYNPVTRETETRHECEYYPDEEKCKICKHSFERKEIDSMNDDDHDFEQETYKMIGKSERVRLMEDGEEPCYTSGGN